MQDRPYIDGGKLAVFRTTCETPSGEGYGGVRMSQGCESHEPPALLTTYRPVLPSRGNIAHTRWFKQRNYHVWQHEHTVV